MTIQKKIQRRIRAYAFQQARIQRKINVLAGLRIAVFFMMVLGLSFSFDGDFRYYGAVLALLAAGSFLLLMVKHDRCYRFLEKCRHLERLSQDDLNRALFAFQKIDYPEPIPFQDAHPFAADLGFVGRFSILKLLDNTFHHKSKALLKSWIEGLPEPGVVKARQEAVHDLADRKRLRLRLNMSCEMGSSRELDPNSLNKWLTMNPPWTLSLVPYILGRVTATLSTTALIAHFFFQINMPWLPLLLINLAMFYGMDRFHRHYFWAFMERGKSISAACAVVQTYERAKVQAPLLAECQKKLRADGGGASQNLKKLIHLYEMLSYRSSGFAHFLVNSLFLWDQHYLRALALWHKSSGDRLPLWVDSIFQVEALSALANFHWLYPDYTFPKIVSGGDLRIEAAQLAHPAIPQKERIGNDYSLDGNGLLHLITGSNMSGKSTFLRSVGVNLVLARMGAPVCAQRLTCSVPKLWTAIQIQDSLNEGVSYFYAEVKRIKQILDDAESSEIPIFYLLDEILKGTNSRERLIACRALVKFLIQRKTSGLITTHDLELLGLAKEHPEAITNYHFQEQVQGEQMFFDYQLKPGELTSTNALRLMKLAKVPLDF